MKRTKVRKRHIIDFGKLKLTVISNYLFQDWIDCDFDDALDLDFEFAKPLPPKPKPISAPRKTSAPKSSTSTVKQKEKVYVTNPKLQQWSDRHAPKNSNDLAVNAKKV